MRYTIVVTRRAKKQLDSLPVATQERIAEAIAMLGNNPENPTLNVKALTKDPDAKYRLRVGSYRVKYNRDDGIKIVEVVRIGHRKDVCR